MPTISKTEKTKRGPFWRRNKNKDAVDYNLKKSPVRTRKTTSSKRREEPMPTDFLKEVPAAVPVATNDYDMSSAIQIDLNTGKTINMMQTPPKQQPGGTAAREYPQFGTEYNYNSSTYTPRTEPPTPPSPVKWQAETQDRKIQSIYRLQQLAQQYNHENSPNRTTSTSTARNTPAIQSADTFDQQFTPTKQQNTKLLETVLGVSTACAPHATKAAIKSYASTPTAPSKVVSMSMIKDGSMKFAEVVKDSVLKFVQCAGDIPLDEDGTPARVLCSNGGDWDDSYYPNHDEDDETYDKNYTYDDDEDDDGEGTFTNVSIKGRDSPVSLMRNDAGFTDDESLGKTLGKLNLNRNNVQRDVTNEPLKTARALQYRPARTKIADLASADPLASNIPFDERSLSGGIQAAPVFENERHAREIALGLDDASMLSDERGEI